MPSSILPVTAAEEEQAPLFGFNSNREKFGCCSKLVWYLCCLTIGWPLYCLNLFSLCFTCCYGGQLCRKLCCSMAVCKPFWICRCCYVPFVRCTTCFRLWIMTKQPHSYFWLRFYDCFIAPCDVVDIPPTGQPQYEQRARALGGNFVVGNAVFVTDFKTVTETQMRRQQRARTVGGIHFNVPLTATANGLIFQGNTGAGCPHMVQRELLQRLVFQTDGVAQRIADAPALLNAKIAAWLDGAPEQRMPAGISLLAMECVFKLLFDVDLTPEEKAHGQSYISNIVLTLLPQDWLNHVPPVPAKQEKLLGVRTAIGKIIARSPGGPELLKQGAATLGLADDELLRQIADPILFAGVIGTGQLMTNVIKRLDVVGEQTRPSTACYLSARDSEFVPITGDAKAHQQLYKSSPDAFILEAARLLAPVSQFVEVVEEPRDVVIDGSTYTLPPGTMVAGCIALACRDPAAFPDPDEFKIDRDHSQLPLWNGPLKGDAPRQCPGERVSFAVARAVLDMWVEKRAL